MVDSNQTPFRNCPKWVVHTRMEMDELKGRSAASSRGDVHHIQTHRLHTGKYCELMEAKVLRRKLAARWAQSKRRKVFQMWEKDSWANTLLFDSALRLVCALIETVRLMDFRVGDRYSLSLCNILPSATSLGKLFTTGRWKNEVREQSGRWRWIVGVRERK